MTLVETRTQKIATEQDLKRSYPNTSFPKKLTEELLASFGYAPLTVLDPPPHSEHQFVRATQPYEEGGAWYQRFEVFDHSENEVATTVRAKRDDLLRQTDWTALSDVTMTPEMATYRQALRDITEQEGFPYSVTWPSKP